MKDRPSFFDLRRLSALGAALTLALAQPLFTLILENPEEFPMGGLFHLWVLAWTLVLPLLVATAVDTLLERAGPRAFRVWTAILCAGVAVSLVRQAFLYYWRQIDQWGLANLFLLGAIPAAGLAFAVAFKHTAPARRYLAVLGLLAAILVATYAGRSGLWGPAWASVGSEAVAAAPTASKTPVFLVVFDELAMDVLLKDGRIDASRYPHFAAFADENAWFSQASANHAYTMDSIPCMLTGKRTPDGKSLTLFHYLQKKYVPTLVGGWPFLLRLMRRGAQDALKFEVRGSLEEETRNPWSAGRILASTAWNRMLPRSAGPATDDDAALVTGSKGAFQHPELIASIIARRGSPGLFVYWHSPMPHWPFIYDADGRQHGRPHTTFNPNADPRQVFENYLEQTLLADVLFGRFIAVLREAKIYESAIVLVTSDHGLRTAGALQPPRYPDAMNGLTPRVPLLLKAPGLRPGRREDDYQHIDLAPTLLDLLDIRPPPGTFDGRSVLAPDPPPRPKVLSQRSVDYVFDPLSGLWWSRNAKR